MDGIAVVDAIQNGMADYGVIPWENSSFGYVDKSVDALCDRELQHRNVFVCGEAYLEIQHALLGYKVPGTSTQPPVDPVSSYNGALDYVRVIYSHQQAFEQTVKFQRNHLRYMVKNECNSTSQAAQTVVENKRLDCACVASPLAAESYGLSVLAANISDKADNKTRFLVLRRCEGPFSSQPMLPVLMNADYEDPTYKSMVWFAISNKDDKQLTDVMSIFRRLDLKVTAWGSRPSWLEPWHYLYFLEFEGRRTKDSKGPVEEALSSMQAICTYSRWYGSWVTAKNRGRVVDKKLISS
jgi:prephenate dehydratase